MNDLAHTAKELRQQRLVDRGLLKAGGRREVLEAMAEHRRRGLHAYLLLLPRGESLEPYRQLWDQLGLDRRRDLLLIFNGRRWMARGWGLRSAQIDKALAEARPALRVYFGYALVVALEALAARRASGAKEETAPVPAAPDQPAGAAARTTPTRDEASGLGLAAGLTIGGAALGLAALGLIAVVRRRQRRSQEIEETYQRALDSAEEAYTQVMLTAEELALEDRETAETLQLEAARLNDELGGIAKEVSREPALKARSTTLGRLQHLEDNLRVLSTKLAHRTQRKE